MLNHHIVYEALLAFAANELSPDEQQVIATHIENCAECSKVVRRNRFIISAMRTDDSREPPPATIARAQAIYSQRRSARAPFWQRLNFPRFSFSLLQLSRAGVLALFVISTLFMCSGLGAVAVSAQSSIPGDALYPVKLNLESVQLAATWDSGERVERHLAFADSRTNELVALVAFKRLTLIPGTLEAFEEQVNLVAQSFESLAKQNFQRAQLLAPRIDQALTQEMVQLATLRDVAVDTIKPALEHAITFSDARRVLVNSLAGQPPLPTMTPTVQPTRILQPSSTPAILPTDTSSPLSASPPPVVISSPTIVLEPTPTEQVKTPAPTRLAETPVVTSTLSTAVPTTDPDKVPPGQDKDKDKDHSPPGQDKDKDPPGQQNNPPGKVK